MKIYTLVEINEIGEVNILTCETLVGIIKSFPFSSNKSLDNFLVKYQDNIINSLGDCREADILEEQDFLNYKKIKWYREEDKPKETLSSEAILELALERKIVTEHHLANYLLKESEECTYYLKEQEWIK